MLHRRFLLPILVFSLAASAQAQQQGIFANIQTSLGRIRVRLEVERAPMTVANFIGLAEGGHQAIDPRNGRVVNGGFYDGLIFHRVIRNFMIQTGSASGAGLDGPGYVIPDEFHKDLKHDAYVVSMANSGANSNGSQFFITVQPRPNLNNVHSVFGVVVEGKDVALKISEVPTNTEDRPLAPVKLESVRIDRVGDEAKLFSVADRGLPKVGHAPAKPIFRDGKLHLQTHFALNRVYTLFASPDMIKWRSQTFPVLTDSTLDAVDVSDFAGKTPRHFFRVAEAVYEDFLSLPSALGKTIDFEIRAFDGEAAQGVMQVRFDEKNGAAAQLLNFSSTTDNYLYQVDSPSKATLILPTDLPPPFGLIQFSLRFADKTKGTFVALMPTAVPPVAMAGDFTVKS